MGVAKAVVKEFSKGPGFASQRQAAMIIPIDLEVDDLKVLDNNADNLSYAKLKEYADSLQKGGYQAYRYQTMMHNKLSAPFAAFVMVILGIPFALRSSRSGGVAMGIGASIAIGFSFFRGKRHVAVLRTQRCAAASCGCLGSQLCICSWRYMAVHDG
jgi:lipopolysaccharide export system permease protein